MGRNPPPVEKDKRITSSQTPQVYGCYITSRIIWTVGGVVYLERARLGEVAQQVSGRNISERLEHFTVIGADGNRSGVGGARNIGARHNNRLLNQLLVIAGRISALGLSCRQAGQDDASTAQQNVFARRHERISPDCSSF